PVEVGSGISYGGVPQCVGRNLVEIRTPDDVDGFRSDVGDAQAGLPAQFTLYGGCPLSDFRVAQIELVGAAEVLSACTGSRSQGGWNNVGERDGEAGRGRLILKHGNVTRAPPRQRVVHRPVEWNRVGAEAPADDGPVVFERPECQAEPGVE